MSRSISRLKAYLLVIAVAVVLVLTPQVWAADAEQQFATLLEEIWQRDMQEFPRFATSVGDHRFNDRLTAISLADSARRYEQNKSFVEKLDAITREQLSSSDKINYDIMRRELNDSLSEYQHKSYLTPITQRSGFHISFPEIRKNVPLKTTADFENYVARLHAFEQLAEGYMEIMRAGVAAGLVLPAVVLEGWEKAVDAQIVEDPEKSLFYEPVQEFPSTIPTEKTRIATPGCARCHPAIGGADLPTLSQIYG